MNKEKNCAVGSKGACMAANPEDNCEILKLLYRAYCDEWLATLQYWTASHVLKGFSRASASCILMEHAMEELEHARKLADRIQQLGGEIPISPKDILDNCNCSFVAPTDPCCYKIMGQSIAGERCAIAVYNRILEFTAGKDMPTHHLIIEILEDEVEHEFEFRQIKEDIDAVMEKIGGECKS